MQAVNKIADVARGEIGYLEKKSNSQLDSKTANAGSGNYTKYARDMMKYSAGIFANGYAWCDTFVDWCFVQAFGAEKALKLIHGWSAYTPTSAGYYRNAGQWHSKPQKGDQIFFKDSKGTICHTGLVYDVDSEYVYTIEGNTSSASGVVANGGAVAKKKYALGYSLIAGYGRPDYAPVEEDAVHAGTGSPVAIQSPMSGGEEAETVYNTIEDCPQWAQPYVKKAVEEGYVKGTGNGMLNLNDTKIWCLVTTMRICGIME